MLNNHNNKGLDLGSIPFLFIPCAIGIGCVNFCHGLLQSNLNRTLFLLTTNPNQP